MSIVTECKKGKKLFFCFYMFMSISHGLLLHWLDRERSAHSLTLEQCLNANQMSKVTEYQNWQTVKRNKISKVTECQKWKVPEVLRNLMTIDKAHKVQYM